jgi:hypothetical protein
VPRHFAACFWLLGLLAMVSLPGCGRSSPDSSDRGSPPQALAAHKELANRAAITRPTHTDSESPSEEEPACLVARREDPDPQVRLNALETWARNPGNSLDPITYALVDPDEQVRARAQELFEEALARQR